MKLSREEQETHFSQTAEDRLAGIVYVYTDDPTMMTQMAKWGWTGHPVGEGMQYVCENAYMGVYAKKTRELTDEQKAEITERLHRARSQDSL